VILVFKKYSFSRGSAFQFFETTSQSLCLCYKTLQMDDVITYKLVFDEEFSACSLSKCAGPTLLRVMEQLRSERSIWD